MPHASTAKPSPGAADPARFGRTSRRNLDRPGHGGATGTHGEVTYGDFTVSRHSASGRFAPSLPPRRRITDRSPSPSQTPTVLPYTWKPFALPVRSFGGSS